MAKFDFQTQHPEHYQIKIVFVVYGAVDDNMVSTLKSFENNFEIYVPEEQRFELVINGGIKTSFSGRQDSAKVILFDDNDALLFKLKYSGRVYEIQRSFKPKDLS